MEPSDIAQRCRKEYPIRSDYRVVLDILQCMNDPEIFEPDMTEDEKRAEQVISMLAILYIDFDDMPPTEWEEAAEKHVNLLTADFRGHKAKKAKINGLDTGCNHYYSVYQ